MSLIQIENTYKQIGRYTKGKVITKKIKELHKEQYQLERRTILVLLNTDYISNRVAQEITVAHDDIYSVVIRYVQEIGHSRDID